MRPKSNTSLYKLSRPLLRVPTHLEPLDGVSLGDLVLVTNLGGLRFALCHAVSGAVEDDVKVHSVDTF